MKIRNFWSRYYTEVSVEHTQSQMRKSSLDQLSCFLLGVRYCTVTVGWTKRLTNKRSTSVILLTYGSASESAISPFLLQDLPRHDTRLFDVREPFKTRFLKSWLVFAHTLLVHVSQIKNSDSGGPPGGGLRGPPRRACAPLPSSSTANETIFFRDKFCTWNYFNSSIIIHKRGSLSWRKFV